MAWWVHRSLTTVLQDNFRNRGVEYARDLADAISVYVAGKDRTGIQADAMVTRLLARPGTAWVAVYDEDGAELFRSEGTGGGRVADRSPGAVPGGRPPVEPEVAVLAEVLAVTAAVEMAAPPRIPVDPLDWTGTTGPDGDAAPKKAIGSLAIGFGMGDLNAARNRAVNEAVAMGLAIALLGSLSAYGLGRSLQRSIHRVSERARSIAEGELVHAPLPEEGRGELLDLARAFNTMSRAVAEREDRLRGESQDLEREVEARTRQLQAEALRLENANDLLRIQKQDVEAAAKAKSDFLATISHELRTPLNSIIGFSDLLRQEYQGPLTPSQREDLDTIHSSAHHLLALINDLLDVSKVEAGRMEVHCGATDVDELVARVRAVASGLPVHPGVEFEIRRDRDAPAPWADPKRLHQVALNLVSNALKFTTRGSVEMLLDSDGHGRFRLRVRDTGPGIPESAHDRIFEPFGQQDQGPERQHGGTGLGLTISRQLVELMGGTLTLESRVGEGSTFTVLLPTDPPEETA